MNHEFEVHVLDEEGLRKAQEVAKAFDDLLGKLTKLCLRPPEAGGILLPGNYLNGREFSIVKTKLEEACFFAKKALALLPENQRSTGSGQTA